MSPISKFRQDLNEKNFVQNSLANANDLALNKQNTININYLKQDKLLKNHHMVYGENESIFILKKKIVKPIMI